MILADVMMGEAPVDVIDPSHERLNFFRHLKK